MRLWRSAGHNGGVPFCHNRREPRFQSLCLPLECTCTELHVRLPRVLGTTFISIGLSPQVTSFPETQAAARRESKLEIGTGDKNARDEGGLQAYGPCSCSHRRLACASGTEADVTEGKEDGEKESTGRQQPSSWQVPAAGRSQLLLAACRPRATVTVPPDDLSDAGSRGSGREDESGQGGVSGALQEGFQGPA